MQQHRPDWHRLGRLARIEDGLWPLVALHALLRQTGVLRLRNRVLAPTRAAADDLAVERRLRAAFEPNSFDTQLTELTIGVLAAHGPLPPAGIAAHVHELLGHRWQLGGQPLTVEDVRVALVQLSAMMTGLDLVDRSDWNAWALGPSARSLLPGAEMLAEVWAK